MAPYRISEQKTRYKLIDPQLLKAGWEPRDRAQVGIEIPVAAYDPEAFEGITDYCLYRENGEVLEYVTAIEKQQTFRPFAPIRAGTGASLPQPHATRLSRGAGGGMK